MFKEEQHMKSRMKNPELCNRFFFSFFLSFFFFFFKILFLERHRERGRDTDRGKSRLHAGSLMWDLIPVL